MPRAAPCLLCTLPSPCPLAAQPHSRLPLTQDVTLLHVMPMLARGTVPLLEAALPSPCRCAPSVLPHRLSLPAGSAPGTQPGSIPTQQLLSPWSRGRPRAGASSPGEHRLVGILAGSNQCSPGDLMQKEALPLPPTLPLGKKKKNTFVSPSMSVLWL